MPNWVEGTLKIRGDFENLIAFIESGLDEPARLPGLPGLKRNNDQFIQMTYYEDNEYFDATINRTCHIKGTSRGFATGGDVYLEKGKANTICIPVKFAWCIHADELLDICNTYDLDMRIIGFEYGMEFAQEIEIINGKVTMDTTIKYDDYLWECPCPLLGG